MHITMRLYFSFILLVIQSFLCTRAQVSPQLINFWDNSYFINPASAHPQSLMEMSFSNRMQWIGINGAPKTMRATASYYNDYFNSQLGVRFVNDKIGYSSSMEASLSYSYIIRGDYSRFVFGLAGSYLHYGFDPTKVNVFDQSDPYALMAYENNERLNADFGIEYANDYLRVGFSSNKLFDVFSRKDKLLWNNNHNYLYVLYRGQSDRLLNIGYGVALINAGPLFQFEANVNSFIRFDEFMKHPFQLGVTYRTGNHIGTMAGIYITERFKILYSYEINHSAFGLNSGGTHELIVRFRVEQPQQWGRRNYWLDQLYNY